MTEATPDELAFVRKLVRDQAGMVLAVDKEYLVVSKLRSLARREQFSSLSELVTQLRDPSCIGLRQAMVEEILIGETCFFRDGHPFEALRNTILPAIIREHESDRQLNLWCAATSTGQEPYSLAILLTEVLPELPRWSLRLLATDLSEANLRRAHTGLYSDLETERGLDATRRARFFSRDVGGWRVREALRHRVEFGRMNLAAAWPTLPQMDLVLLRNVLIYFDVSTRAAILEKMRKVIRRSGYLLLGASETLVDEAAGFTPIRVGPTILYRCDR